MHTNCSSEGNWKSSKMTVEQSEYVKVIIAGVCMLSENVSAFSG